MISAILFSKKIIKGIIFALVDSKVSMRHSLRSKQMCTVCNDCIVQLAMCLLSGFISYVEIIQKSSFEILDFAHTSPLMVENTWSCISRLPRSVSLSCLSLLSRSLCAGCFYAAPSLKSSFVFFFFSQLFHGIYIYEGGFHPNINKNYSPGCL